MLVTAFDVASDIGDATFDVGDIAFDVGVVFGVGDFAYDVGEVASDLGDVALDWAKHMEAEHIPNPKISPKQMASKTSRSRQREKRFPKASRVK